MTALYCIVYLPQFTVHEYNCNLENAQDRTIPDILNEAKKRKSQGFAIAATAFHNAKPKGSDVYHEGYMNPKTCPPQKTNTTTRRGFGRAEVDWPVATATEDRRFAVLHRFPI